MSESPSSPEPRHSSARARDKILSIAELSVTSARVKAEGRKVVLCHGVFDLLHMGHVRHLEIAKREGHVLIVTITADAYVNKGPGRPVFTEQLRAEMLAALEYVDFVGINDGPTAEPVLMAVKPDVYVKGSDYINAEEDVSGKIIAEREAVQKHGGKIIYTDDITFSSSTLINKYLNIYEPSLQDYLESLRNANMLGQLLDNLDKLKDLKVLFVGDAIIDEYQYVQPMGKSAKENMIATLFKEREVFAGGVFAAANHVADFCDHVEVITSFGAYESYEDLARDSLKANIQLHAVHRADAPTTRKCRFIDTGYTMRKLFEVYVMDDAPLLAEEETKLKALIEERIAEADVVIVTDFGHGLLSNGTVQLLIDKAPFLAVNTQSNSANHGYNLISKYAKADYICIDGVEARLAAHEKFDDLDVVVSERLPEIIDCAKMVVTKGKHGCVAYEKGLPLSKVPALTSTIVDTVGAGDAFFAVTAPLVATGVPMDQVGFLGNAVGAMKVGIVGHRTSVEKIPLTKFLTALLK